MTKQEISKMAERIDELEVEVRSLKLALAMKQPIVYVYPPAPVVMPPYQPITPYPYRIPNWPYTVGWEQNQQIRTTTGQ
jgi:hypothetical protein